ncbi:TPA: protein kinase activity protein [Trebouxia sp. C0004]
MGLSGGAIAGIVIGCVVFVVAKTACMFYSFKYWYKRRQRILAARRGREKDVERGTSTPLDKLAAVLHLKNKGGSSTGSSSSTATSASSLSSAQSLPGWVMDEKDIEILQLQSGKPYLLGVGSFGTVYKALRQGVQPVAVKKITQADDWQMGQFIKEINLMEKLSFDRNIVQFYGAVLSAPAPMLVLEYMEGGDLRDALSHDTKNELGWYNKGHLIALDVIRGLVFLHSNKVVHADLKAKNVLLTQNAGTAKIADVGLARIMQHTMSNTATGDPAGTFAYAAPEMLMGEKWDDKADVYSLGVLLWEIITSDVPERGRMRPVKVPEECPEVVAQLIGQCLEKEVSARPNARQVYNAMQAVLQGEGGLPDEPVRVVNTEGSTLGGSSGTDSTFDSAGSRISHVSGGIMSAGTAYGSAKNSMASSGMHNVNGNGNGVTNGTGIVNGNNGAASGTATGNGINTGVRISRGNTALNRI